MGESGLTVQFKHAGTAELARTVMRYDDVLARYSCIASVKLFYIRASRDWLFSMAL